VSAPFTSSGQFFPLLPILSSTPLLDFFFPPPPLVPHLVVILSVTRPPVRLAGLPDSPRSSSRLFLSICQQVIIFPRECFYPPLAAHLLLVLFFVFVQSASSRLSIPLSRFPRTHNFVPVFQPFFADATEAYTSGIVPSQILLKLSRFLLSFPTSFVLSSVSDAQTVSFFLLIPLFPPLPFLLSPPWFFFGLVRLHTETTFFLFFPF